MATVTVDSTSQRYTSRVVQDPDILLLHTTEVWGWPGYNGGGTAPHDTIKPLPGVGIIVRRHYPYDQFSKSLENDRGGVETNKRGCIQVELMGTCDPGRKSALYFWPDADDAVLEALADYYRPIMAKHGIPARAMAEFIAYPKSSGDDAAQRLSFSEWMNGSGICGHQHAPENAHGDPGAFPVARFIKFLTNAPQEDEVTPQDVKAIADEILSRPVYELDGTKRTVGQAIGITLRNSARAAVDATVARALAEETAKVGRPLTAEEVAAASEAGTRKALSEAASIEVVVKGGVQ